MNRKHDKGALVDAVETESITPPAKESRVTAFKPVTVYLAHPYSHRDIGSKVESLLVGAGITVVNPFERPDQSEIDRTWPDLAQDQCTAIVREDLNRINGCDTVVAILVGEPFGTAMEIYHNAVMLGRVTFALVLEDKFKTHPWVRTLTRQFFNVEDLITSLLEIANGSNS